MSQGGQLTDQLTSEQIEQLAEGIARGEYNLLLGAGASIGASGRDDRPVSAANGLKDEFFHDFRLPGESSDAQLGHVYEAAQTRFDTEGRSFSRYLEDRFTGCRPATWHFALPGMVWHRIWTLNIDDTVERAYELSSSRLQEHRTFNWTDMHQDGPGEQIQVVHLHGIASVPDQLVFSVLEYRAATAGRRTWHHVFGDHFQQEPFLTIGARLVDEVDLSDFLRRGSASHRTYGRPSFVVLKEISELTRESFLKGNLIPIEMSADEFMAAIRPFVEEAETRLAALTPRGGRSLSTAQRTFLDQFTWLRPGAVPARRRPDFYSGYDPSWYDIVEGLDAKMESVDRVVQSLSSLRTSDEAMQRVELIHGPWGTGKTTALLRIGFEMLIRGMDVFLFRADSRLDVNATVAWLEGSSKTLLLFDGLADHAPDLERIFELCKQRKVSALVVATERQGRIRQVHNNLSAEFLVADRARQMVKLSNQEIGRLLNTLRARTRLGRLTRQPRNVQHHFFSNEAGRNLFIGMSRLEGGLGFVARIQNELSANKLNPQQRSLIIYTAYAYYFGYALPIGILSEASGMKTPKIINEVDSNLSEWLSLHRNGVKLRHRHVAALVIERALTMEERHATLVDVARSIGSHVNIHSVRERTLPYLIARNLLDAKRVHSWLGPATAQWYAEIAPEYDWNARYWEQRALAWMQSGDLAAARSYAERALGIHRDPFTLTTLANIVLRSVVAVMTRGDLTAMQDYWDAVSYLKEARENSRSRDDHAYTVFFNQSLSIARQFSDLGGMPEDFKQEFNEWLASARFSPLMGYPEYARLMRRISTEWMKVVVARSAQ
ncbi:MAG TPA: SIR2 family protein [Longimicrobium sp.]|jgi:hypothetical protein